MAGEKSGKLWVYPDRKRCFKCRKYFGFLILDGLYDSYECAGRQPENPDDWPREHFVPVKGTNLKKPKHVFLTLREAQREAKRTGKTAYQCGYCANFHVGTQKPNVAS